MCHMVGVRWQLQSMPFFFSIFFNCLAKEARRNNWSGWSRLPLPTASAIGSELNWIATKDAVIDVDPPYNEPLSIIQQRRGLKRNSQIENCCHRKLGIIIFNCVPHVVSELHVKWKFWTVTSSIRRVAYIKYTSMRGMRVHKKRIKQTTFKLT